MTRPGGTVALQEPDVSTLNCYPPHAAWDRLRDAIEQAFACVGADVRLTTLPNGRQALSHGFDPAAGSITNGVWDVMADEGGLQTWVAYLTGSITLPVPTDTPLRDGDGE